MSNFVAIGRPTRLRKMRRNLGRGYVGDSHLYYTPSFCDVHHSTRFRHIWRPIRDKQRGCS